MITMAYSKASKPSALAIAAMTNEASVLHSDSYIDVDVNWGRYRANSALNPNISNVTNKRVMRELFKEHGVPMPELWSVDKIRRQYASFGNSPVFVGRPDRHSKKRGFWKITNETLLDRAIAGTRRKKAATHFIEYVEHDREYRVHIFKGKSIRISEKEFNEDGSYTTKKPGEIKLRTVRDAAKSAVAAVGLDFGAVDILAKGDNNEEVFVLEVNAAPGLGGTMPQLYADTFEKWKNGEIEG